MRFFKIAFARETAFPVLALIFASAVCFALVVARIFWTGNIRYGFLIWNLVLAWLPLAFAMCAYDEFRARSAPTWRLALLATAWLLFFPNAPYICTDIIHLATRFYQHFWVDLVLVLSCALTGLVLGFLSLFLMQSVVVRVAGRLAGWLFIAGVACLSSFGIYLGRFLRFNSWDVLLRPFALSRGIGRWIADPMSHPTSYAFPALFAMFLIISYLMLYALTHLPQMQSLPEQQRANAATET